MTTHNTQTEFPTVTTIFVVRSKVLDYPMCTRKDASSISRELAEKAVDDLVSREGWDKNDLYIEEA